MYDFNNLVETLKNGNVTPEEVAEAFADSLNEAIKITNAPTHWEKTLGDLADDWNFLVDLYWTEHNLPEGEMISDYYTNAAQVESIFNQTIRTKSIMAGVREDVNTLMRHIQERTKEVSKKGSDEFDTIMTKFFKDIGL